MQAEECWQHEKLEESRKGSPEASRGIRALPTPWVQIPTLQNYERIRFSGFKPPGLGKYISLALSPQVWV